MGLKYGENYIMKTNSYSKSKWTILIPASVILIGLYFTSLYSYLLFHSLAEIFSIVIACGIFIVAWNSRQFQENNYLLLIGVAYLFIGGIDLVHTLAYTGMGVFDGYGANLPTQLWIAARSMESITFLIASLFFNKKITASKAFVTYLGITSLLLISILTLEIFPDCFIEGQGLTPFKKISEYIISVILLGSIILLRKAKNEFDIDIFKLIVASVILTIGAELVFTFYVSVYGLSNLIGHFLKIISFYLVYRAIIKAGFTKPYKLVFRNLKKREEELRKERDKLKTALDEINILRGLLPICANCKKILDDKGYWNQLESYFEQYSEVSFSHSLCPECSDNLYDGEDWYIKQKSVAASIEAPELPDKKALAALPVEWLVELKKGIKRLDSDATQKTILQIKKENPQLAANLQALVDGFRFDILNGLIEEILNI